MIDDEFARQTKRLLTETSASDEEDFSTDEEFIKQLQEMAEPEEAEPEEIDEVNSFLDEVKEMSVQINKMDSLKKSVPEGKRLRTVKHFLCDNEKCNAPIVRPKDGFVVHGNIYEANPDEYGGLIGNNFPKEQQFGMNDVQKTVYCKRCFLEAIGINMKPESSMPPLKPGIRR